MRSSLHTIVNSLTIAATFCGGCDHPPRDQHPDAGLELADAEQHVSSCDEAAASKSVAGCRFVQLIENRFVPPLDQSVFGCFALVVANPNAVPATLRLRYGTTDADAAPYARLVEVDGNTATYSPLPGATVPPNGIAVVSTLHVPWPQPNPGGNITFECPSVAFIENPQSTTAVALIGERTQAIELVSNSPVLVMNVHNYQWQGTYPQDGSSKSVWPPHQLFPFHISDTITIETGKFKPGSPLGYENLGIDTGDGTHWALPHYYFHGRTSIAAFLPDTTVWVEGLDGTVTATKLDRGETFTHLTEDAFVGRAITADKPVSLVSAMMAYAPWDYPNGFEPDYGAWINAAMPLATWGSEYVAVRHADRWPDVVEQPPWRIIGGVDGTTLTYQPSRPAGAPATINRGELVIFEAGAPFSVHSQDDAHPFFLGGHMTGGRYVLQRNGRYPNEASRGGGVSIAEVPVSRWSKRYPFFALLDWPEQSLVVVRHRDGKDVTLDCAGVLTGWRALDSDFEYTYVQLTGPDLEPIAYGAATCRAGPHWIESEDPFRATLWAVTQATTRIEFSKDKGATSHHSAAYALPLLGYDAPPISVE